MLTPDLRQVHLSRRLVPLLLLQNRRGTPLRWLTAALLATTSWTGVPTAASAAPPPQWRHADTIRAEQWQLDELDAHAAWRYATGAGVTVGVIDSGVDGNHADLIGRVLPGIDLVNTARDGRYDAVGHGTTVAGLIAGRADDDRGVAGLAPDARILPVRVLDATNRYDDATVVAQGIRWAVDHGARILNVSLGGPGESKALAAALSYAFAHDVVVIACTGNKSATAGNQVWFPARLPGVVAVSGLDERSKRGWSNAVTGPATVLTAPATALVGARPGGYWVVQGTSFAAPLVTATAALIRSRWPTMSAANVINRLVSTAQDLGPAGRDPVFGYGRVDPYAAVTRPIGAVADNPLQSRHPGRAAAALTDAAPQLLGGRAVAPPSPVFTPPTNAAKWAMLAAVLAGLVAAVVAARRTYRYGPARWRSGPPRRPTPPPVH